MKKGLEEETLPILGVWDSGWGIQALREILKLEKFQGEELWVPAKG